MAIFVKFRPSQTTVDYRAYLRSDHWQQLRRQTLIVWDYRCAICNSANFVEVHHRDYSRLGHERATDVIALCRKCHGLFHDNRALCGGVNR